MAETDPVGFTAWLARHRRGELAGELTEKLVELTKSVGVVGKVGTLTLTVKLTPAGRGEQVLIEDKVAVKTPEPDSEKSLYFVTRAGALSRRDPNQGEMPFVHDVEEAQ